jgi:hypothetical protein
VTNNPSFLEEKFELIRNILKMQKVDFNQYIILLLNSSLSLLKALQTGIKVRVKHLPLDILLKQVCIIFIMNKK